MNDTIEQEMQEVADLCAMLNVYDKSWYIASKTNTLCILVTSRGIIEAKTLTIALRAALALYGAA